MINVFVHRGDLYVYKSDRELFVSLHLNYIQGFLIVLRERIRWTIRFGGHGLKGGFEITLCDLLRCILDAS